MDRPLISVIIPVGSRHRQHCLVAAASVQWQTVVRAGIETILVGDGAGDMPAPSGCTVLPSTGEICGPAHTRNRGLEVATGQFITFLDADDYLLPRGLEHLLRAYSSGKNGYVYGDAFTIEKDGTAVYRGAPDYVQSAMANHNVHVITTLIPAAHANAVGGFDERGDAWEDWRFHLRLAQAGICGYRTDQPVFVYRVYEGDRMTRFYPHRETMEPVWRDYRNSEGVIPMARCCGGDPVLAHHAGDAITSLDAPTPVPVEGAKIRVRYTGTEGSIPFDFGGGIIIRLGNNAQRRYADVTPEQAQWLAERVPIEVVPQRDSFVAPPEALKLEQLPVKAIRPKKVTA